MLDGKWGSGHGKTAVQIMYLLTEWEGQMGKYLARGHDIVIWIQRSEPCAMTESQIFYHPLCPLCWMANGV